MSRHILGLMFATTFFGVYTSAFAAPYVERDGRYEINWSTGKVRFYGVAKPEADEGDFRSAGVGFGAVGAAGDAGAIDAAGAG